LKRFNVRRLREPPNTQAFQIALENRYSALQNKEKESATLEEKWKYQKQVWLDTCEQVMGIRKQQDKEWISSSTFEKIKKRKSLKEACNNTKTRAAKQTAADKYRETHKEVKRSAIRDKREYFNRLALEAEEAAGKQHLHELYANTRKLAGKANPTSRLVHSKH
jgi:hypothetical protein